MAVFDADKKVEKIKKDRAGIYQSSQHPEHFENEGGEYSDNLPNNIEEGKRETENTDQEKKRNQNK